MIMTVVTGNGKLQAAAAGDIRWSEVDKAATPGQFRAGLTAGPDQTIRVVEVPDKLTSMFSDPNGVMAELTALLKQRGLL
jgi:hypothetical protein